MDNKEKISQYGKEWYKKNREKKLVQGNQWYKTNHKERLNRMRKYIETPEAKEKKRINSIKWRNEAREWLFEALGGAKCAKCGFDTDKRALQFDHILGNGNKFRKTRRNYHSMMVYFRKNSEFAKQLLQVLCSNCNQIKKFKNNEVAYRK